FHKLEGDSNADGLKDPLVFGEGLDPQQWPNVSLSNDGKWLLVNVSEGWTNSELYLKNLSAPDSPLAPVASGKNFLYNAEVFNGEIYLTTNEDAPRFRVFRISCADPQRAAWKEIIPQSEAVIDGRALVVGGSKLFVHYLKNASSAITVYDLQGKHVADVNMP